MECRLAHRLALGRRLRECKNAIAVSVTDEFLRRHPDWITRYGEEHARRHGVEDAAYHLEFLAAAVDAGSGSAFEEYVRWTAGVLSARGIRVEFLAENLLQIEDQLGRALSAADRDDVAGFLAAGLDACKRAPTMAAVAAEPSLDGTVQVFVSALLTGQRAAAVTIAGNALARGASAVDLYVDLFQAALHEIGRRWERNEISVADEHMATAIVQYVLAQIYERLPIPAPTKGRLLVAGVGGELHQLGPNIVADVLETHGWDVRFLGTNVPTNGLLSAIEQHHPDVLGLSLTMLTNAAQFRETVAAVRARFGDSCPRIVAGGRAFRQARTLWRDCGADAFATDVRDAVSVLG
ncbi:MAG TPA: cobalamin-dependent protein [Methylomirabilota bacterium]|jgi:methanogenic corrinoid protein MtbC1|nr:cobalamin-dependent protein [Methylomirabilota bacterium]